MHVGRRICFLFLGYMILASCASMPTDTRNVASAAEPDTRKRRPLASARSIPNDKRQLVAEGALSLIGAEVLTVNGQTFPNDCTGLVRAAYWYAGIDLTKDFGKYTGNGVTRIYKTLESANLLYATEIPQPGDVVFWDNTYDRNEDGQWNDPLTHVGVVVSSDRNGQIGYVHANYSKGIVTEFLNLADPDTNTKTVGGKTVMVNSAMRMKGQVVNSKWLSSHLLRGFGKGYLLE